MSGNGWPLVPLSEVMTLANDRCVVERDREYPNFGIYSFGRGVFRKPPIQGMATSANALYKARTGQFVYSRLFAFEGAYGFVRPEYNGSFVSNEFPLFDCRPDRMLPEFLAAYFSMKRVWVEVAQGSTGVGHRRQRVQPAHLLGYAVPLPPLSEQRRIVAAIDALAAKIAEGRELQQVIQLRCDQLCRALLGRAVCATTPMEELVRPRDPDIEVAASDNYHFAGVYCFGRGVFVGQKRSGMEFAYKKLTRLRQGDFVYPKLMAWEGALAVVPPECDGLVVSPEFPVFEVDRSRVLPEILDVYFRSPEVWPVLSGTSTGTNVRRRRLNPSDFLKFEMPLPRMEVQQQVREAKTKVDRLKALQARTAAELDALLPAILGKAFKGEL